MRALEKARERAGYMGGGGGSSRQPKDESFERKSRSKYNE